MVSLLIVSELDFGSLRTSYQGCITESVRKVDTAHPRPSGTASATINPTRTSLLTTRTSLSGTTTRSSRRRCETSCTLPRSTL
jgi:hypothetical protein